MNKTKDDIPNGFKMTGLGPLPEKWEYMLIDVVIEEIVSGDWGKPTPFPGSIKTLVIRGTDFAYAENGLISGIPIRYVKKSSIDNKGLSENEFLVEMSGGSKKQPTGRIMIVSDYLLENANIPILYSNFVKKVIVKRSVEPFYFRHYWAYLYVSNRTSIYEKRTTGIRNFKLNDFLANEHIPLPPLPEQKAIAQVLRTVQTARERTEAVIAAARELKKSLMRHLFTYGPVPVNEIDRVKLKQTEIGSVPEEWEVVKLGEIADIKVSSTSPKQIPSIYGINTNECRILYLKVSDMNNPVNKRYIITSSEIYYIKNDDLDGINYIPVNSIIMPKRGAAIRTNKKRLTGVNSLIDPNLAAVIPNNKIDNQFCYFWFESYDLNNICEAANLPQINKKDLAPLFVPLPAIPEQQAVARILSTIDRNIEVEEARRAALDALFKSLLHNLMTGKIRVAPEAV